MTKMHFTRAAEMVKAIVDGHWTSELPRFAQDWHGGDIIEVESAIVGNLSPEYVRAVWTAEAFIILFRGYNPRFDEQKFLVACGLAEAPKKGKR